MASVTPRLQKRLRHQHSPGQSSAMIAQSPEVCASVLTNIFLQMDCRNSCGGQSRSLHLKEQWKYPWWTSISTQNQSVLSPSTMTAASQFSCTQWMSCTYFIGIPQSARICHIEGRWMLSKAALKSTKLAISIRRQTILSTHPLPLLKPPWFSRSFLQCLHVIFPKWWAQTPSQEQIKGRYHGSYYTWNGLPSWK